MELKVEMEDGTFEFVADVFMPDDDALLGSFRVHKWGDVWLVATLNDNTKLLDENGKWLSMGTLRHLEAHTVTTTKSGGELRRPRTFADRKFVNKNARPFSNKGV